MVIENSNLRLKIKVNEYGKIRYYYDIGLRGKSKLSKWVDDCGRKRPRYLEDFIEIYGADNVQILSWGKCWRMKDKILSVMNNEENTKINVY